MQKICAKHVCVKNEKSSLLKITLLDNAKKSVLQKSHMPIILFIRLIC